MHALLNLSPWQKTLTAAMAGSLLFFAAVAITSMRMESRGGISESGTGLGINANIELTSSRNRSVVGGVPGAIAGARFSDAQGASMPDRQIIPTASLEIFSNDPVQSAASAEQLAYQYSKQAENKV